MGLGKDRREGGEGREVAKKRKRGGGNGIPRGEGVGSGSRVGSAGSRVGSGYGIGSGGDASACASSSAVEQSHVSFEDTHIVKEEPLEPFESLVVEEPARVVVDD